MVCLTDLVLLLMVASPAISFNRNYMRSSYPRTSYRPAYYSRTSHPRTSHPRTSHPAISYVPAYSAKVKNSDSAVSNVPLCKAGGQLLLQVFVEKDDNPVLNAMVSYVDNKGMKTVSTDQNGLASLTVFGCSVALIINHKDGNPVYKTVDLLSSTTSTKQVVIKVDDRCNFNLVFSYTDLNSDNCGSVPRSLIQCGDENQLISLIYSSTSNHIGYEQVVAKTACITAGEVGDNLKVVLVSQVGNINNVLDITITDFRTAVVALPPQLPYNFEYDIVLTANTVQSDELELMNHLFNFALLNANPSSDIEYDENKNNKVFMDLFSATVKKGLMQDEKRLLAVQFEVESADNEVVLEGNVVVNDSDGNYQSVQYPTSNYVLGNWFLVGCFCNNAPSMKARDFFPLGMYCTDSQLDEIYRFVCNSNCNVN